MFIKIRHPWKASFHNGGLTISGQEEFTSHNGLPVKLNISCGLWGERLTVVATKTPDTMATAAMDIIVGGTRIKSAYNNDWANHWVLPDMLLSPLDYQHLYRGLSNNYVEITWVGLVDEPLLSPNLYNNAKRMLYTGELSDVLIKVDDREVAAHKIVLAAQSSVFLTMFNRDTNESTSNQIQIKDIDYGIMKIVIEFLYTGEINENLAFEVIASVLSVAQKFQIKHLKKVIENLWMKQVTADNALRILRQAHLYGLSDLIEMIDTFVRENSSVITTSDDLTD